jgi:hypothetical protein
MARPTSTKPGRRPTSGRPSLASASTEHKQLSPAEVLSERLALAHDMLALAQDDAALPAELQARVRVLCEELRAVWHEVRLLP